jgi:hypothetical protein
MRAARVFEMASLTVWISNAFIAVNADDERVHLASALASPGTPPLNPNNNASAPRIRVTRRRLNQVAILN